MPPRVSVVVPTFDRLRFLPQTLRSVARQTLRDFEVIVVDDGSRDGTAAWLRSQRLPGLTVLRRRSNAGVVKARNLGLSRCRGELVAMLDSDDLWRPTFLEELAASFERPRIMAAFSNYDEVDGRGRLLRSAAFARGGLPKPAFLPLIGYRRIPPLSATVFRRSLFDELGGFDESFRRTSEDTELFLRAGLRYGPEAFRFVRKSLVRYRKHAVRQSKVVAFEGDAPTLVELAARGAALSPKERDVLLDSLYAHHKHRRALKRTHAGPHPALA